MSLSFVDRRSTLSTSLRWAVPPSDPTSTAALDPHPPVLSLPSMRNLSSETSAIEICLSYHQEFCR